MKSVMLVEGKILGFEEWKLRMMWLPIVIVGLMVVSWMVVIGPRIDDMSIYRQEAEKSKKSAEELNQKRAYLQSADEEEVARQEELLAQALPNSKNLYFMMSVMENIARNNQFIVDSFSVSPGEVVSNQPVKDKVKNESLAKVPLKVVILGPQENYLAMVSSIEKALPLLSIDDFKMSRVGSSQVKMDLVVATYFALETLNIKISNLKLDDLLLSKDELVTMEKIAGFTKLEMAGGVDTEGKAFVEYNRISPFSL